MQVMPKTAEWILEKNGLVPKNYDLYNARDNIIIGTLYYKYLSKKFDGNLEKIMAAYNGGSVRVRNNTWRNVTETSNYVKRIDWAMKAYEYKLPIYLKIKEFLWILFQVLHQEQVLKIRLTILFYKFSVFHFRN